jgi:phage shock protein C
MEVCALAKRLTRSRRERILGGVCGGLAEYLGIDPTIVRLVWAALTVFTAGFPGVLLYLLGWFIIPEERIG